MRGKGAMDVDGVDHGEWDESWGYDQGNWDVSWEMGGDIDALGKGKSMGKGGKKGKGKGKGMFFGDCYNCHQPGHSAKFCPYPQKGNGKGKGKQESRECWNCGMKGHLGRDCPTNPTKGKGKGYKGKGIYGVDESWWTPWDNQHQHQQPQQQQQHQHQQQQQHAPPWVNTPPPPQVSSNIGVSFGGSLDSVCRDNDTSWATVVSRSRGKHDMRPIKRGMLHGMSHTCVGNICSLDREALEGNICGVEQFQGEWERIQVTADSGAIDSVCLLYTSPSPRD